MQPELNHRYVLHREWGFSDYDKRSTVNFIMLNPSTADDVFDDATIRRCVGFAKRWGFDGLVVTNLFAFRATDPKDLKVLVGKDAQLAIGHENDKHLAREASYASLIVCAWGDNCDIMPHRDLDVVASLRKRDLYCIRRTKKGNPAHPVREPYLAAPEIFYSRLNDIAEAQNA